MEYYFFWRHRFGQWTMRDMIVDGITYCCCEQFMMAEKARLFGDEATRAKIMASKDPKEIKNFGREVVNERKQKWTDADKAKWNFVAKNVVFKGNMAKFSQHEDLKTLLLETGDKILAEASPFDPIWGIGLRADHPDAQDKSKWQGTNWLGEVLMNVRYKLRENQDVSYPN